MNLTTRTKRAAAALTLASLAVLGLSGCSERAEPIDAAPTAPAVEPAGYDYDDADTDADTDDADDDLADLIADMEANAAIVRELIVGYWMWEFDTSWVYIFEADGTGVRGSEEMGHEEFLWEVVDDEFRMHVGGTVERWAALVTESTAVFESLQVEGMVLSYIRLGDLGDFDWILEHL